MFQIVRMRAYVFDSQGCTGIRYKCIGCEHGVIVLEERRIKSI